MSESFAEFLTIANQEGTPLSFYAFSITNDLLKAFSKIPELPAPAFSADGEGGLSLEWVNNNKRINVVIPGNSSWMQYVYIQEGEEDSIDRDLSAENIINKLKWLTQ